MTLAIGVRHGVASLLIALALSATTVAATTPMGGIGVNYFDVYWRLMNYPRDRSHIGGFRRLAEAGIPFARFAATPYWPDDMKKVLENPKRWLETIELIVASAGNAGVTLIPCVFMNYRTLPDALGEPISSWNDPDSKTVQAMRRLTAMLVSRYKDSPVILAWEFTNEMNTFMDLPDAQKYMQMDPRRGTPDHRTERDRVQHPHLRVAYREFANAARAAGATQLLSTGNDGPRWEAWHLARGRWERDSRAQFIEVFRRDTPEPYALGSIHLYPNRVGKHAWISKQGIRPMVREMVEAIRETNKIPYIGEFGVKKSNNPAADKQQLAEFLEEIVATCTPLSALWVYEFSFQEGEWNVSFANDRAYQINMVADANKRLHQRCGSRLSLTQ